MRAATAGDPESLEERIEGRALLIFLFSFRKLPCDKLPLQFHACALIFYRRVATAMAEKVIIFGKDL